jgi:hemolysin-activating ACP:hemolysin acyltransferase
MHNQFRVARVRKAPNAQPAPAGFAMWASVSDAVDQRLRSATQQPVTLAFEEWKSGTHLWLIDLVAPSAIAASMLKEIDEKVGKGNPIFTHVVSAKGAMTVTTVGDLLSSLKKIPA